MKLTTIIDNFGTSPSKILVPTNSGLKEYRDIALQRLGIGGATNLVEARAENIPELCDYFTGKGEVVFGLTGDDLVDEYRLRNPSSQLRVIDTTDWYDPKAKYGRPTLCFMGKEDDSLESLEDKAEVVVNKKYEATSRQYLDELSQEKGLSFGVIVLDGGTEDALAAGVGRYAIETVYSGASMEEFGLKPLYIVRQSDVDLVTSWHDLTDAIRIEWERIEARKKNPTGSETSRRLGDPAYAARKVNEEAYELAEASLLKTGRVIPEAADLLYSAIVTLVQNGVTYKEFCAELRSRQ